MTKRKKKKYERKQKEKKEIKSSLDGNEIINRKYRKELRHIHEAITIKMERKEKKSMALREAIANRMEVCVC